MGPAEEVSAVGIVPCFFSILHCESCRGLLIVMPNNTGNRGTPVSQYISPPVVLGWACNYSVKIHYRELELLQLVSLLVCTETDLSWKINKQSN